MTIAKDHPKLDAAMVQEVLLDDSGFLRTIVERVLQELLEAEMTEHIGAAIPTSVLTGVLVSVTATSRECSGPGSAL